MKITVLDPVQIEKIHKTSLAILEKIGVEIPHEKVLDLFTGSGAVVDHVTRRVRITENLIMSLLDKAGKQFVLYGRDKKKTAHFGFQMRNYNTIAGEALWIDDKTQERRYASLPDVTNAAKVADGLPWITIAGAMADPHEIPVHYRCVVTAAELLKITTKPITFWFHDRASAKFLKELFIVIAGCEKNAAEYPVTYAFLEPISPLRFPFNGIDLLFETSTLPLPVSVGPMAQTGMSSPVTLAGTLAQENAEILAGICITQLIRPGIPVCYGGIPHAFDMRTTQMIFGGPEQALMAVAMTQMGKYYGLPVYINVGLTDSKTVDAQAGLEVGTTLACGVLAGADIFGHLGICGVDQGTSLEMLMMQHEAIGYMERIMRGMEINDDTLALDTISSVGPGGTFISTEHTVRHFRKEIWFPEILDRNYWQTWVNKGKKELKERCYEKKEVLLKNYNPVPLARETMKEIETIIKAAERL